VPILLRRLLDLPAEVRERYDTSALRTVACSGSALPAALATDFMNAFGDVLYNIYGSTEVSWASIASPTDLRAAPGSVGHPPRGTRLAILDADGVPVPAGGRSAGSSSGTARCSRATPATRLGRRCGTG